MPHSLHGKPLSSEEHELWKSAREAGRRKGKRSPEGYATQAVLNARRDKKHT